MQYKVIGHRNINGNKALETYSISVNGSGHKVTLSLETSADMANRIIYHTTYGGNGHFSDVDLSRVIDAIKAGVQYDQAGNMNVVIEPLDRGYKFVSGAAYVNNANISVNNISLNQSVYNAASTTNIDQKQVEQLTEKVAAEEVVHRYLDGDNLLERFDSVEEVNANNTTSWWSKAADFVSNLMPSVGSNTELPVNEEVQKTEAKATVESKVAAEEVVHHYFDVDNVLERFDSVEEVNANNTTSWWSKASDFVSNLMPSAGSNTELPVNEEVQKTEAKAIVESKVDAEEVVHHYFDGDKVLERYDLTEDKNVDSSSSWWSKASDWASNVMESIGSNKEWNIDDYNDQNIFTH